MKIEIKGTQTISGERFQALLEFIKENIDFSVEVTTLFDQVIIIHPIGHKVTNLLSKGVSENG